MKKIPRCIVCHRERHEKVDSVYLCVECKMKCYCENCDRELHADGKKTTHKRKRIVLGKPYKARTTMSGDNFTFPKTFDWVTIHYKMHVRQKEEEQRKRDMLKRFWKVRDRSDELTEQNEGASKRTSEARRIRVLRSSWLGGEAFPFVVKLTVSLHLLAPLPSQCCITNPFGAALVFAEGQ